MEKTFVSFDAFQNFDFSSTNIEYVRTLGHSIAGIGAATYVKVTTPAPSQNNAALLATVDGSVWQLVSTPICPEHFGAIPEKHEAGVPNVMAINRAAIQAFLMHITLVNCGTVCFDQIYKIDGPLYLGLAEDGSVMQNTSGGVINRIATRHIVGSPFLRYWGDAVIDTVFTIFGFLHSTWDGKIEVESRGGEVWANRKAWYGIKMSFVGRSKFGGCLVRNMRAYGLLVSSELFVEGANTNGVDLGNCSFRFCGSGAGPRNGTFSDHLFFTTQWSKKLSDTGNVLTNVIETTALPDLAKLERSRSYPYLFLSNQSFHTFLQKPVSGNTDLTIDPVIDPNLSAGSLKWIFGGGLALRGNDVSVVGINLLDAVNCAIGLDVMTLYGPKVQRVIAQSTFLGTSFGLSYSKALKGVQIDTFYAEGNYATFLRMCSLTNESPLNIDMFYVLKQDQKLTPYVNMFHGTPYLNINKYGELLSYEKQTKNRKDFRLPGTGHPIIDLKLNNQNIHQVHKQQFHKIEFFLEIDIENHNLFGYNAAQVTVLGNGTNHAPTGEIQFTAPTGYTINGAASWSIQQNFEGPAIFSVYFEYNNNNFLIATATPYT